MQCDGEEEGEEGGTAQYHSFQQPPAGYVPVWLRSKRGRGARCGGGGQYHGGVHYEACIPICRLQG